ncbi:MAG TPA: Gfo/Idh/MocA family oxidoreductase [Bryobacteraceae bacterium]|jgi:predicted dehydrogenase
MKRRDFVAGAALAAGARLMARPADVAASDRIRVAVIGMGIRGRQHMQLLTKIPGVEVAAFCDPDETRLQEKCKEFEQITGKKPRLEQDLRRVLDDHGIDAVTIATCNHWHALATIWACQAGKHVYVEKPVCHDLFEGSQMVAASRRYNKLVQGGTQRRSSGYVQRAIQALHGGVIGDVYMARCIHYQRRDALPFRTAEDPPSTLDWNLWVGPGPMRSFNRNLVHYNWHWFWDYGSGELGNNGIHYIDIARWGLNRRLPSYISSNGGRFGYRDQAETPNTQLTTYRFEDGTELIAEIRGRFTNAEGDVTSGLMFYGSKGYMISDHKNDGHFYVYLDGKSTPELDLGTVSGLDPTVDDEVYHFQNFFDAVRANKREMLAAEIEQTFLSSAYCLLGNISYRTRKELHFDPQSRRFTNDSEANEFVKARYRAPFVVPDAV